MKVKALFWEQGFDSKRAEQVQLPGGLKLQDVQKKTKDQKALL